MFRISSIPLEPAALRHELPGAGAGGFVTFEGRVRNRSDGKVVTSLAYEAFGGLAEKEGARIMAEARLKFGVIASLCVHRVGLLEVGEIAMWIGVAAAHREAAFDACRFVIDEVKRRVPIWKRENYADGSYTWISHPAGGDSPPRRP
jgi:molybdopterin synthase catalytic subunit